MDNSIRRGKNKMSIWQPNQAELSEPLDDKSIDLTDPRPDLVHPFED